MIQLLEKGQTSLAKVELEDLKRETQARERADQDRLRESEARELQFRTALYAKDFARAWEMCNRHDFILTRQAMCLAWRTAPTASRSSPAANQR